MKGYVSKGIGREGVAVLEPGFALIRPPGPRLSQSKGAVDEAMQHPLRQASRRQASIVKCREAGRCGSEASDSASRRLPAPGVQRARLCDRLKGP